MKLKCLVALVCVLSFGINNSIFADVLVDASPDTTGGTLSSHYVNVAQGQNFGELVQFTESTLLTGIDIYSRSDRGGVGAPVVIKLFQNLGGFPGGLITQFNSNISIIDNEGTLSIPSATRKHAAFQFVANPGDEFFIGMSGNGFDLTQTALLGFDDQSMAQFNNNSFAGFTGVGDMAFRLHGESLAIPEPTMVVWGLGISCVALMRRRRDKRD